MKTNIISLISIMVIFAACKVEASNFYQWTDKGGTVAATDNQLRIPPQYRDTAVKRSFGDLEKTSRRSFASVSSTSLVPPVEADQVRISVTEAEKPACTGKVSVNTERRQVGEYNRTFYTITNECGFVVYDSPTPVRLEVDR